MPFISIATLMITVGFAFVCIYIAQLILHIAKLLNTVGQTVSEVEKKLDKTILETEQLMSSIEKTAIDVEEKMQATSGVFNSLENIGEATAIMSETVKEKVETFKNDEKLVGATPFIRAIQWSEYTSVLLKSWKHGKKVAYESNEN